MRATCNFNVTASKLIAADATRVRIKTDATGNVMLLATARKVISGLDKLGEVARTLTRDKRKNTLTLALNMAGLSEGVYVLVQGKHGWLTMQRSNNDSDMQLCVARVRVSKKSG